MDKQQLKNNQVKLHQQLNRDIIILGVTKDAEMRERLTNSIKNISESIYNIWLMSE